MSLIEVVAVCMILILFVVVIVQPLIILDQMRKELVRVKQETFEIRNEIIKLREQRERNSLNEP